MVMVPLAIFVSPFVIRQTYRIVFSAIATTRISTSNSSSKRSGRWKSNDAATRGHPTSASIGAMLRPASRQSACSASSMYLKNQLKCTMPAASVS